eukprot:GHVQ01014207.1.p1 GENE.GHVQ01014207.1~~GHVQ01014207.1.p1  ORF type:complete len:506 (+),score=81.08 GHVQ01014207.1:297-1814(+)
MEAFQKEVEDDLASLQTQLQQLPENNACPELQCIRETLNEAIQLRSEALLDIRKAALLHSIHFTTEQSPMNAVQAPQLVTSTIDQTNSVDTSHHDDRVCRGTNWGNVTELFVFYMRKLDGSTHRQYGVIVRRVDPNDCALLLEEGVDGIGCGEMEEGRGGILLMCIHTPRKKDELPCRDGVGICAFGNRCRFHHGVLVYADQLHAASTHIEVPCEVICKTATGGPMWCRGTATNISTTSVTVKVSDGVLSLPIEQVLPFLPADTHNRVEGYVYDSDEEEEELDEAMSVPEEKRRELQEMRRELELTGNTDEEFGQWMKYTSGLGLKLLRRYGYRAGESLKGSHHALCAPLEIVSYPPGCSLDYIMEQKQRQAGTASRRPKKKRRHKDELEDEEEDNEAGAFELLNKTRGGLMNLEQEQSAQKKAAEAEGTHQMELSKIRRAKTSEADLRKLSLECQHKIRNVTEQLKSVEDNMKRHRGECTLSTICVLASLPTCSHTYMRPYLHT